MLLEDRLTDALTSDTRIWMYTRWHLQTSLEVFWSHYWYETMEDYTWQLLAGYLFQILTYTSLFLNMHVFLVGGWCVWLW